MPPLLLIPVNELAGNKFCSLHLGDGRSFLRVVKIAQLLLAIQPVSRFLPGENQRQGQGWRCKQPLSNSQYANFLLPKNAIPALYFRGAKQWRQLDQGKR